MAALGPTYSEIETARAEVAAVIARQRQRLTRWKAEAGVIVSEMNATGAEYGPIVDLSAALLLTDPTNEAFIVQNKAIGKHLVDFNTLVAEATALDVEVNT